jgi:hypothetical protein
MTDAGYRMERLTEEDFAEQKRNQMLIEKYRNWQEGA